HPVGGPVQPCGQRVEGPAQVEAHATILAKQVRNASRKPATTPPADELRDHLYAGWLIRSRMLTQPAPPVRAPSRPLPPLLVLVPGDGVLGRPVDARQHDLQELANLRHRGSDALFPPSHTGPTSETPAPAAPA